MQRNVRFDLLRILMSIWVVMLHVAAVGSYAAPTSTTPVLLNSVGRIAVPIFFMVSGAIGLSHPQSLHHNYSRMLRRILVPLLLSSVAYAFFRKFSNGESLAEILLHLNTTPAYYHLSFMYQMIGLYLFLPLLQRGWQMINRRAQFALTAILTLWMCLSGKGQLLSVPPIAMYIVYAMLGACCMDIAALKKDSLFFRQSFSILCIAIYIVCTIGTWRIVRAQSAISGYLNETYFTYDSPLITLGAICFFLAVMLSPIIKVSEKANRFLAKWNKYTLGIYLIHPMLLTFLSSTPFSFGNRTILLSWNMCHPIIAIPALTIFVYLLSLIAMILLNLVCIGTLKGFRLLTRQQVSVGSNSNEKKV